MNKQQKNLPVTRKKTAQNLWEWVESWTPEQRRTYQKLAESIEIENKRGPKISTNTTHCEYCGKKFERGDYINIIEMAMVDEWEVPKGEMVFKIQNKEPSKYYHEDCLGRKLM